MALQRRSLAKIPYLAPETAVVPVPAPTGGWDAITPLATMEQKYAPILANWVPRPGWVELRRGFSAWAQNLAGAALPVETLMTYRAPGVSEKLFAATNKQIWDVSTAGIPTQITTLPGALTSNRWQYCNFTPSGGSNYLLMVNGSDAYLAFDGTNWTNPSITGVSASSLININVHKRRIWFVQANSTAAWYLGTDAISGTATLLDLGAFMTKGGKLVAMGTWTVDGGFGPDDYAVFVTSRGQAILYKGTDPTNANAWAIIGTFDIPPVVSNRCFCRLGADMAIITLQGVIPLSQALPFDPSAVRSVALTQRIQNQMLLSAAAGQNLFGWQALTFPAQSLFILNVPLQENANQVQYVMNVLPGAPGAWCQFTGWSANCFEIFNDGLYFGDNKGNVNQAYSGAADLVTAIAADMQCAFNYFGDPGRLKRVPMVQPIFFADGSLSPSIGVDADFVASNSLATVTTITPAGGIYDTSVYDTGTYAAGATSFLPWLSANAIGRALALRLKISFLPTGAGPNSVFDTGVFDTMVFDGVGTSNVTLQVNAFQAMVEAGGTI